MNRIFLFLSVALSVLSFIQPQTAQAQNVSYNDLIAEFDCRSEIECNRMVRSIQRDSKAGCRPEPAMVEGMKKHFSWLEKNYKLVGGHVFYANLIGGVYGYFMYSKGGKLIIHSRVHFRNWNVLSEQHQKVLQQRFNQAAQIWKQQNPLPYPVEFIFEITPDRALAHVKDIELKNKTQGPYFRYWNVNWDAKTIAHEFGHVMGLDDEYSYLINNALKISSVKHICEKTSIMCQTHNHHSEFKPYHYYMILRRLHCS